MRCRHVVFFLLFLLLLSSSLHTVSAHASTGNGVLLVDNQRKVAYPNQLVQFDLTITNDKSSRESFIIRHVWENSVLSFPMNKEMGDDDQKVYDSSLFGNHGTLNNFENSGWAHDNELNHYILSFDGVDDYVGVTSNDTLNIQNDITVEAWVYPKRIDNILDFIVAKRTQYGLVVRETGQFQFRIYDGSKWIGTAFSKTPDAEENVWTHVVGTFSDNKIRVYLNGEHIDADVNVTGSINVTDYPLCVGCYNPTFEPKWFKGAVKEVRIYNQALTAREIKWLYNGSWKENLSSYNVELGAGESKHVTFSIKVPENAKATHVQNFLLTTFPQSDPVYRETKTVEVEVLALYYGDFPR